jgi:hypothetical protein
LNISCETEVYGKMSLADDPHKVEMSWEEEDAFCMTVAVFEAIFCLKRF